MKRDGSSSVAAAAPRRRAAKIAVSVLAMSLAAACASGPSGPSPGVATPSATGQGVRSVGKPGLTPPFMAGRDITRIGLLLPFSSLPADADAFYNAAELALFDHGGPNTLLMPRDVGADPASAENAGRSVARDGADMVLGPLRREQVGAAARPARDARAPMIAFSSDSTVAGEGVYILSFPLEPEAQRIAEFATAKGLRSFAVLAPDTEYGRRFEQAFRSVVTARGGQVATSQFYARGATEAASSGNAAAAARTVGATVAAQGIQAILIADFGAPLRATGPALLQSGVDLRRVRLLGTGQWASGDAAREPTLAGGWYPAPEPGARSDFESRYRTTYGRNPPRLASLAYDAVAIASALSREQGRAGLNRANLERADGFIGSDGLFRFRRDGGIERAMAILEVKAGGANIVEPAPKRFTAGS